MAKKVKLSKNAIRGKQIRLNEQQLREFISYSVARILKEAWRPSYFKHNGIDDYDGDVWSEYGSDSLEVEPDEDRIIDYIKDALEEPEFQGLTITEDDLENISVWPVSVKVRYSVSPGRKGDGYLQPDDPDEYEITDWEIEGENQIQDPKIRSLIHAAVERWIENSFDLESEASYNRMWESRDRRLNEWDADGFDKRVLDMQKEMGDFDNKGICVGPMKNHEPENPYEGMTWDEYCEAKAAEHERRKRIRSKMDPAQREREDHMFDDDYWVRKEKKDLDKLAQ